MVGKVVVLGGCAYVWFLEEIEPLIMRDQGPDPDIELTIFEQKGVLYVLLDDK